MFHGAWDGVERRAEAPVARLQGVSAARRFHGVRDRLDRVFPRGKTPIKSAYSATTRPPRSLATAVFFADATAASPSPGDFAWWNEAGDGVRSMARQESTVSWKDSRPSVFLSSVLVCRARTSISIICCLDNGTTRQLVGRASKARRDFFPLATSATTDSINRSCFSFRRGTRGWKE